MCGCAPLVRRVHLTMHNISNNIAHSHVNRTSTYFANSVTHRRGSFSVINTDLYLWSFLRANVMAEKPSDLLLYIICNMEVL